MQEIAAAIQTGAAAYLKRQYKTIAMVGVVLTILIACVFGPLERYRLCRRCGSVRRVRLHRHERVGARQRAHRTGGHQRHWPGTGRGIPRRRNHRHAGGGLGLLGVTGFFWFLVGNGNLTPDKNLAQMLNPLIGFAFGSSLISIFARWAVAFSPRVRTSVRTWWAKSRPVFRKTTHATRR
jgi:K(+)-stimulated pyrophosphate-energized sodium pump